MRSALLLTCLAVVCLLTPAAVAQDVCAGGDPLAAAGPFPLCGLCWTGVNDDAFCGQDRFCMAFTTCTADSDCAAGERCAKDTCCGPDPICIVADDSCMDCVNPGVCGTFAVCEAPPPCDTAGLPECLGDCPPGLECAVDGGATDCSCQVPMLVVLDYLRADVAKRGVMVSWKTIVEIDNAGFRVLRETTFGGEKVIDVVSPQIIHPQGSDLHGAEYSFLDASKRGVGNIAYYLEDIDLRGQVTRHGPVSPGEVQVEQVRREQPTRRENK